MKKLEEETKVSKMKVEIKIAAGNEHREYVVKSDFDSGIQALERAIEYKPMSTDWIHLTGILSIIKSIQKQVPNG